MYCIRVTKSTGGHNTKLEDNIPTLTKAKKMAIKIYLDNKDYSSIAVLSKHNFVTTQFIIEQP